MYQDVVSSPLPPFPPLQKRGGMVNYLPSLLHLMSLKRCQAEKAYRVSLGLRGLCCSLGYRGGRKVVVLRADPR